MLMLDRLLIPAFIRTDSGIVVSRREALCVLLYRLAFPCRLKDMRLVFGLSESCTCETFNWILHFSTSNGAGSSPSTWSIWYRNFASSPKPSTTLVARSHAARDLSMGRFVASQGMLLHKEYTSLMSRRF